MIIAIDGPAGSGKSTVAKLLAKKLGFLYIDTGAMYRALTLKVLKKQIDVKDVKKIAALAMDTEIDFKNYPNDGPKVLLDKEDVTGEIRSPEVTGIVSDISKIAQVRKIMLTIQRNIAKENNAVMEGRDIGTVVFPDAKKKFFIDAEFKERVKRRFKELQQQGNPIIWQDVEQDLRKRDKIDSSRKIAPLKKAKDAIYLDTTNMAIDEVVDALFKKVQQ